MTEPTKYRKKPVTIEAMRMVGTAGQTHAIASWVASNGYPWLVGNALEPNTLHLPGDDPSSDNWEPPTKGLWIDPADGALMIRTLEGDMRVTYGDYIIRGIQGEFYPCKPDIFAQTYEEEQS